MGFAVNNRQRDPRSRSGLLELALEKYTSSAPRRGKEQTGHTTGTEERLNPIRGQQGAGAGGGRGVRVDVMWIHTFKVPGHR